MTAKGDSKRMTANGGPVWRRLLAIMKAAASRKSARQSSSFDKP
jgi:hypothetical protein